VVMSMTTTTVYQNHPYAVITSEVGGVSEDGNSDNVNDMTSLSSHHLRRRHCQGHAMPDGG